MSLYLAPTEILVPGRGLVNLDALAVDRAVKEYDERLCFGFNPTNEDWVIYIKLPRNYQGAWYEIEGEPVMPVLGFGKRIPSPDAAMKRVWETDAWRNGEEQYDKMVKHNAKLTAQLQAERDAKADEAFERVAHAYNTLEGEGRKVVSFDGSKRRRGYNVGQRDAGRN